MTFTRKMKKEIKELNKTIAKYEELKQNAEIYITFHASTFENLERAKTLIKGYDKELNKAYARRFEIIYG